MKHNYLRSFPGKANSKKRLLAGLSCLLFTIGYSQQSYTFTNCGVTGMYGPSQGQVTTAYQSTNLNGLVTVNSATPGVQLWTVPASGAYRIETYGAEGGSAGGPGGLGAIMRGDFTLTGGQVLKILVGQAGGNGVAQGGGGGGSYVTTINNTPLCIAGGGGGGYYQSYSFGTASTAGTVSGTGNPGMNSYNSVINAAGGTNGTGGATGPNNPSAGQGAGGGGLLTNGGNAVPGMGGAAFVNGGKGGTAQMNTPGYAGDGGFGGGGAGEYVSWQGSGGGGGYSGGGGGYFFGCGGGGGSFNAGTNQLNASGTHTSHGRVIIRELCNITLSVTGVNANNAICAGNSVTLTTNAISNYTWSNGATTSSIVVTPTSTTGYTLGATSPSNCTAYSSFTVNVNSAIPSLTVVNTASASGGICPTRSVNLTASGATTYTWSGSSPTVTNGVTFFPVSTNTYVVTGENACGTTTAATSVSIHPFPSVNPSASSSTLCTGSSLTLTAVGNATNYTWSGGSAPSGNGVGFFPAVTATYIATGTSSLACTNTAAISVTVFVTPNAVPVASPPLICIGKSTTLTATGASNYTWTNGVQTVNTASFLVTPAAPGVSTYTVIKSNSTCTDVKTISVTTNALPSIFGIASPPVVCALQPSTLSIGGGISYTWTAPGTPNFTFTGASPIVYPATSSDYTVAASDGTCVSVTNVSVTVNPNPTITASASSPSLCIGQQITLSANGGNSYTWTATTGTFYTQTVTDSPTTAVAYNVTGDNASGCTASAQQIVLVYPNPSLTVTVSKPLVCSGGPSILTASGAGSYTWDPTAGGAISNTVTVNPQSPVSALVTYTVSGSNAVTGCQSSKTVQVNVYVPTLSVSGVTNACMGGQLTLGASGGNPNSYSWNTGAGIFNFPSVTTTISAATVFTLSANSTSANVPCPVSQTVAVGLYPNPNITATAERSVICSKEPVQLYAGGGVSYSWSNSMSGGTITVTPPNQTNNYVVTGTDANGCVSTATVQVKLQNCTGIAENSGSTGNVYVYPNPNTGMFTIKAEADMNLFLLNELGQVIKDIPVTGANGYTVVMSDLAEGIYFLSGHTNDQTIRKKIVVTK